MRTTFTVEAQSQSTSRSFLGRVKAEAVLFDDVKAMRSVKKKSLLLKVARH
jgi:hypothetical protein